MIYLLPVMIHECVRSLYADTTNMCLFCFFSIMEAGGGTFNVVLFIKCSVVIHLCFLLFLLFCFCFVFFCCCF